MLVGVLFVPFAHGSPVETQTRNENQNFHRQHRCNVLRTHTCLQYTFPATTSVIAPGKSSSLYRDAQSSLLLTRLIDPSWWKSKTDSLNRAFCGCLVPLSPQGQRRYLHFFFREKARDCEARQGQREKTRGRQSHVRVFTACK